MTTSPGHCRAGWHTAAPPPSCPHALLGNSRLGSGRGVCVILAGYSVKDGHGCHLAGTVSEPVGELVRSQLARPSLRFWVIAAPAVNLLVVGGLLLRQLRLPNKGRAALLLVLVGLTLLILATARTGAEEWSHDFRRGLAGSPALQPIGPNYPQVARPDDKGLRINLQANRPKRGPVGVATRFRVRGNFEITASYEILNADVGTKGYGAGARLWVKLDAPTTDVISLGRVDRVKDGRIFVAYRVSKDASGKDVPQTQTAPSQARHGKLRLARTGTTLAFLVADGDATDFREIHRLEVGSHDLEQVQFTATTGDQPTAVDLRLRDLTLRADKLPSAPSTAGSTAWLWWAACAAGAVILLGGLGFWFWARRPLPAEEGRSSQPKTSRAASKPEP